MNNKPLHIKNIPLFSKEAWKYFSRFYKGLYSKLISTSIGSAGQALLVLPVIFLVRYAFDDLIPNKDIKLLIITGLIIFLLRLLNSVISVWFRAINIKIINTAIFRLREDILLRLFSFSRKFHTREDQKIMHARIVQDTERLTNMSTALISRILPAFFTSFALLIVLAILNWILLLILLGLFPLIYYASHAMGKKIKKRVYVFQRAFENFSKGIYFVLRYMDLTVVRSAEKEVMEKQNKNLTELQDKTGNMAYIFAINAQLQEVLTALSGISIIIVGGTFVAMETMSLGEFLSFYIAAAFLSRHVQSITSSFPDVVAGNESMLTLYKLASNTELNPYSGSRNLTFENEIRLDSVSFKYEEKDVLRDLNLKIRRGEKIAIIGANGAGKTTIINLILGLYAPIQGSIYVDNVNYNDIDCSLLRQSFGVVLQHPPLFSGSIRENIMFGASSIGEDEMYAVCHQSYADDFIKKLPGTYDTEIGEEGVLLSGGECQRLAIAQAMIRNPGLLILDEPTNHLDTVMVKKIMDRLKQIDKGPAILLISHDMSVVEYADIIYKLENGTLMPFKGEVIK